MAIALLPPDLLPVFNALPGANLLLSPDLRIVAASDDYLTATLTQRTTIVGQFIFDAFPDNPQTPEANAVSNVRAALTQVLATRQPHEMAPQHYDVPDPARPGRFVERHWLPRHTPVLDAHGQVQFIIQSVQDITANRLTKQRLRESQAHEQAARADAEAQRQRLYQVLMQLPLPLVLLQGPAHVVELINPQCQRLFPRRQLRGLFLREGLPELEGQGFFEALDHVYRTGEPFQLPEAETWADFGDTGQVQRRYYHVWFLPFRDTQGQVTGVLNPSFDVTEQVHARQQVQALNEELAAINAELRTGNEEYSAANMALNEAQQQLRQLNQGLEGRVQERTQELQATNEELHDSNTQLQRTNVDLDNFIYTASHDLKAPISNIEGLLLALEYELPSAGRVGEVPAMLTMMQEAIERFKRTIAHLTDITRLQKEHGQASEAVPLARVVEAVRLDLQPLLAQTQAHLTVTISDGQTVTFAEKNLRSVVYNLLSNALKYRHPDRVPRVQIRSRTLPGYTVLDVQDNGLGLDAAQQAQLFGMFQRLHTHVEGTGIGLYMVKKIVENAGGRIEVESQVGQGSAFRVYFRR